MQINNPEGNIVSGEPTITGKCSVTFKGENNRLVFGKGVRLKNVNIAFHGSNGVITIEQGCRLVGSLQVLANGTITIGSKTGFNKPCWIQAYENTSVTIGNGCLFANIRIRTTDMHSIIDLNTGKRINPDASVRINDRVWLAENVCIYKGVEIGEGSIVGAGSIVTRSVPANSIAAGVPAQVVRSNVTWDEKRL